MSSCESLFQLHFSLKFPWIPHRGQLLFSHGFAPKLIKNPFSSANKSFFIFFFNISFFDYLLTTFILFLLLNFLNILFVFHFNPQPWRILSFFGFFNLNQISLELLFFLPNLTPRNRYFFSFLLILFFLFLFVIKTNFLKMPRVFDPSRDDPTIKLITSVTEFLQE